MMTKKQTPAKRQEIAVEQKIIVVFDICSSSNIIEDLTLTDNLERFREVLIILKQYLHKKSAEIGFDVYKFTGDGWILLFPPGVDGETLMRFLTTLSRIYRDRYRRRILPVLESKPEIAGLSFGIDQGKLMRIVLMNRVEYVGRALNIACRLQGAIKDKDDRPMYKVLASNPVFRKVLGSMKQYKPVEVTRSLRNIKGGARYQCVKLELPV